MEIGQVVVEEPVVHGSGDAGVVDHDVQSAEPLDGQLDQCAHLVRVGDVGDPKDHLRTQLSGQRLTPFAIHVGDHDARPLVEKSLGDPAADTRCASGDDCHLAGQLVAHLHPFAATVRLNPLTRLQSSD